MKKKKNTKISQKKKYIPSKKKIKNLKKNKYFLKK